MDTHVPVKERYGFRSVPMRALLRLVQPFCYCRGQVPPHVAHSDKPVVFICNHYEIFGPLAVVSSLPVRFRLWANAAILDASSHVDKFIIGTQHVFPWMSEDTARRWITRFARAGEKLFHAFDPICVDREDPARLLSTMRESVRALQNGDSIVIFPETGLPHFAHGGVNEFYPGFAMLGEIYRRRTGQDVCFCPLYIDKKSRRLLFGQLVTYGELPATEEYRRVADDVRGQMLALAGMNEVMEA